MSGARMKVVLLDGHTLPGHTLAHEERIFAAAGIDFAVGQCATAAEAVAFAADADGVMTVFCPLDRKTITQLPQTKVFVRYGIGYDAIDIAAASERGIPVCNLPTYCVTDVALHTLALVMNALRKVALYDRSVRRGEWNPAAGYTVHRPESLTLGFLGFGNIARTAAAYIRPLGFRLLAYDPYIPDAAFQPGGAFAGLGVEKAGLPELLAHSDFLSLHTPHTPETRHMINRESIAAMKPGVVIINTSRGELIDTAALLEGLDSGKVQAACLDVIEREPLSGDHRRLLEHEHVTVTPHCSYFSAESAVEMHVCAAESAVAVLRGERPANAVNRRQIWG